MKEGKKKHLALIAVNQEYVCMFVYVSLSVCECTCLYPSAR